MDILIQITGFCFIPLLSILIYSGVKEIFSGLKEHYQFEGVKFSVIPFNGKMNEFIKSFGLRRLNVDFVKSN